MPRRSLGNGGAKCGPGLTVLRAEKKHYWGEYGTVDKALVYNVMVILGLPSPSGCNHSIIFLSSLSDSTSPGSGDFSDCTLTLILCLYFLLPPFLPCRKNSRSVFLFVLQFVQFVLWTGPDPSLPVYFNADLDTARFSGPQAR